MAGRGLGMARRGLAGRGRGGQRPQGRQGPLVREGLMIGGSATTSSAARALEEVVKTAVHGAGRGERQAHLADPGEVRGGRRGRRRRGAGGGGRRIGSGVRRRAASSAVRRRRDRRAPRSARGCREGLVATTSSDRRREARPDDAIHGAGRGAASVFRDAGSGLPVVGGRRDVDEELVDKEKLTAWLARGGRLGDGGRRSRGESSVRRG